MPTSQIDYNRLKLDPDGYIENPEDWNIEVAKIIAKKESVLELTENHFKVIFFLRDYFKQNWAPPMIRKLCSETGYTLKEIYKLFPTGPNKGAIKIAGLSKPSLCC